MFWRSAFFLMMAIFGFQVRRLDVRNQSPFKSGMESFLQRRDLSGRAIGRDDDLFVGVIEGVERMKELFLGPFLCRQ